MTTTRRRATIAGLALVLPASIALAAPVAVASDPGASSLKAKKPASVKTSWGGSFIYTGRLDSSFGCNVAFCDTHELTVSVPKTYWKKYSGNVTITVTWSGVYNDLDLAVFDANGAEVGSSGEALTEFETVDLGELAPGTYTVEVSSFLAEPGLGYEAVATLKAKKGR